MEIHDEEKYDRDFVNICREDSERRKWQDDKWKREKFHFWFTSIMAVTALLVSIGALAVSIVALTEVNEKPNPKFMSTTTPVWQPQEPPFDHPDSCCRFRLDGGKAVVATRNATVEFTREEITGALELLQAKAIEHDGLDYLQVFKDEMQRRLWVIEDGQAITALLPEDY